MQAQFTGDMRKVGPTKATVLCSVSVGVVACSTQRMLELSLFLSTCRIDGTPRMACVILVPNQE